MNPRENSTKNAFTLLKYNYYKSFQIGNSLKGRLEVFKKVKLILT